MKTRKTSMAKVGEDRGVAVADEAPVILDFVESRIAAYNHHLGGGVGVRKDRHGYTLFHEDCGEPVARLRPRADGRFAVLYWSVFSERWKTIGDFGDVVLGLDDALEYISTDPMNCFWH
ncbi:MAG: hypothetical protein BGO49_13330 [Planctomycetales bacterium 71-10]|nr:MAG: hypothetical protein BGO49_13330 [Planctomycetales bacterium 71-10]